ncbi:hypothetical protein HK407_02g03270 [Ordospora pajunii]|uniref:uncharacterized protein n=1 Tax=Ordospora pajunii TaxID=3039483 RepID=UPI0029526EF2|nr:uncharacterized protein HK407_02g03270 [Ordospora pajunii]KAH9411883.1 hypothetical protein HK407_02g03270 [Ordospora pajunii]
MPKYVKFCIAGSTAIGPSHTQSQILKWHRSVYFSSPFSDFILHLDRVSLFVSEETGVIEDTSSYTPSFICTICTTVHDADFIFASYSSHNVIGCCCKGACVWIDQKCNAHV